MKLTHLEITERKCLQFVKLAGLVSLFIGTSIFVGYLMLKLSHSQLDLILKI